MHRGLRKPSNPLWDKSGTYSPTRCECIGLPGLNWIGIYFECGKYAITPIQGLLANYNHHNQNSAKDCGRERRVHLSGHPLWRLTRTRTQVGERQAALLVHWSGRPWRTGGHPIQVRGENGPIPVPQLPVQGRVLRQDEGEEKGRGRSATHRPASPTGLHISGTALVGGVTWPKSGRKFAVRGRSWNRGQEDNADCHTGTHVFPNIMFPRTGIVVIPSQNVGQCFCVSPSPTGYLCE